MDAEKFAKVYEQYRNDAVAVVISKGFSPAIAEDAVQEAAIFFFTQNRQETVTKSLFIQIACKRARDVKEALYGGSGRVDKYGRAKGKTALEVHVGDAITLASFETGFEG